MAFAAGFDGLERLGALEDVLGRLKHAVPRDFGAEAAGAGERFDDAVGAHAAEEGLVGELRFIRDIIRECHSIGIERVMVV